LVLNFGVYCLLAEVKHGVDFSRGVRVLVTLRDRSAKHIGHSLDIIRGQQTMSSENAGQGGYSLSSLAGVTCGLVVFVLLGRSSWLLSLGSWSWLGGLLVGGSYCFLKGSRGTLRKVLAILGLDGVGDAELLDLLIEFASGGTRPDVLLTLGEPEDQIVGGLALVGHIMRQTGVVALEFSLGKALIDGHAIGVDALPTEVSLQLSHSLSSGHEGESSLSGGVHYGKFSCFHCFFFGDERYFLERKVIPLFPYLKQGQESVKELVFTHYLIVVGDVLAPIKSWQHHIGEACGF